MTLQNTPPDTFIASENDRSSFAAGCQPLPTESAISITKGFRNSRLVIVEEMGHVPNAISNLTCLGRIMLDFFAAPLARLDSGFVDDMRAPPFEIPIDRD